MATNKNATNKNALEQADLEQAALEQADLEQAETRARHDFIMDGIKTAIRTMLKSESEALLEIMTGFYKLPGDMLQGVIIPAKLASKTSGKVLSWAIDNHSQYLALLIRIVDSSNNKEMTIEQATVRAVAIIKAHFIVKPYADLF